MGKVDLKRIDPVFNPDYIYLKTAKITRDYFDYYLHDLSSKEAKDKFVEFCKEIIKVEICENLELYNDDDEKSTAGPLYVGEGINGSKIAFRINTKSNWMKHYEHDMKKYSEEDNNLFSEFYFITHQDIIPKVLFNNEIKYLSKNKIQVHLFDRKWLVDKIFEHEIYMNIAIKVFELSNNLKYDEEIVNYKNSENPLEQTLAEVEKMFDDFINPSNTDDNSGASSNNTVTFDELKKQYDIAIAIVNKLYNYFNEEENFNNKMYIFDSKYKKILEMKGSDEELIKFTFDSAVRYFFTDEDSSRFIDCFQTLCGLLEKNLTPDLYEINTLLWTMLRKLNVTPEDRGGFLTRINTCYEQIIEKKSTEEDEIKIAHANTFLSMYTKDEKSKRMDSYSKILLKTYGHNNIRLYYFAMLFMEDRFYFSTNHDLVDLCVESVIKVLKDHNIPSLEIGRVYLKQAMDKAKINEKQAMDNFNEALKLFKESEEGKYQASKTLYEIAKIFDKKKMFWIARNMYVYGLTECIKLYEKKGVTSKIFLKLASKLKTVELSTGRIMYSTRFYCLEQIIQEINNDNVEKSQDTYDFALAVLVYKTPLIKLEQIGRLSRYFEKYGLYYSNIAVKHELGHYDKKLLNALDNNKKTFDDYVAKWKQQPVGDQSEEIEPWYGVEYKSHLNLDFMGCKIKLDIENKSITLEYASMLYSALQSVLYNADVTESQLEKITIYILYDKESMFNVNVIHSKIYDTQFIVKIGRFDKDNRESQQQILKAHIVEFVNNIMNTIFRYKISFNKIKTALDNNSCIERNEIIAASFVNALDVFGFSTFNYNLLTSGYDNILSNRSIDDVFPNQNLSKKILELKRRLRATFEKAELIREKVRHNVVNVNAWDEAIWETVDIPNKAGNLPTIAFVFKNEKCGKDIFDTWIEKYTEDDKNNYIGMRVLKKIDASEPFKYRIVVGNTRKIYNEEDDSEIETPVYTCTVSADNVTKLYTFERLMKTNTNYLICPAFYDEDGDIVYDWSRTIKKRASSIKISNVWEIDMNDLLFTEGVFSTDKPVVTHGEDSIALLSLIEEKKIRVQVLNAALDMTDEKEE